MHEPCRLPLGTRRRKQQWTRRHNPHGRRTQSPRRASVAAPQRNGAKYAGHASCPGGPQAVHGQGARAGHGHGSRPAAPQPPAPPRPDADTRRLGRRRPFRRSVMPFHRHRALILLVIGDRVALAVTENQFASRSRSGFPGQAVGDDRWFPFLYPAVGQGFQQGRQSRLQLPRSPAHGGSISISKASTRRSTPHISGFSSSANAKVGPHQRDGVRLVRSLAAAGWDRRRLGDHLSALTAANKVKITAGLGGFSPTPQ